MKLRKDSLRSIFCRKTILSYALVVLKDTGNLIGLMGFQRYGPGEDISYLLTETAPDRRVGVDPNFIEVELTYAFGTRLLEERVCSRDG